MNKKTVYSILDGVLYSVEDVFERDGDTIRNMKNTLTGFITEYNQNYYNTVFRDIDALPEYKVIDIIKKDTNETYVCEPQTKYVGRCVRLVNEIMTGHRLYFIPSDMSNLGLITSSILDIEELDNSVLAVHTENSVYKLEEINNERP